MKKPGEKGGLSKSQAKDKEVVFQQEGIESVVLPDDGTNALNADSVAGTIGDGNAVFKGDGSHVRVRNLQKESAIPLVKLHFDCTGNSLYRD